MIFFMEIQSLCRCVALQIVIIIIFSLYFQFQRFVFSVFAVLPFSLITTPS